MQKIFACIFFLALCAFGLTACAGNRSGAEVKPEPEPASAINSEPESASAVSPEPEPANDIHPENTYTPKTESAPEPEEVRFTVESYAAGKVNAEYVTVNGLADAAVQEKLNGSLRGFFLREWLGEDTAPDAGTYESKAKYYDIGGKYLSVVRILSYMPEGGAYPTDTVSAMTWDMTTGETAQDLIWGVGEITPENAASVFRQLYPDHEVEEVLDKLAEALSITGPVDNWYLTSTGVSVFINHDVHAQGDYFIFEAPYEYVVSMLSGPLANVVLQN